MSVFPLGASFKTVQYFTQVNMANGVYAGELVYRHVFKPLPHKKSSKCSVDQAAYVRIISTSCGI